MKNNTNKGFTIVELLASIGILALVILLVVPSVQSIMSSSKKTLLEFKKTEIIAAANKYANKNINDYQKCLQNNLNLEKDCRLSINTLIKNGYIDYDNKISDNEYEIYDPLTNEKIEDNILICYNPITIKAEAEYKEDENFTCSTVYSNGSYVKLNSQSGILYVPKGGTIEDRNSLNVKLISNSTIDNATCDFAEKYNNDISCSYNKDENEIVIKPKKNSDNTNDTIKLNITPSIDDKNLTSLVYTFSIKETSLTIDGDTESCLKAGDTETLNINSENSGIISIDSDPADVIETNIKNNKLILSSYIGQSGTTTLTLTEGNAYASTIIKRYVYTYEESEFPSNMGLNKTIEIPLNYEGESELEVVETNDENNCISNISYDKDNKKLIIKSTNNTCDGAEFIIKDNNKCFEKTKSINVTNIQLDESDVTLYVGGEKKYVGVTSDKELTCKSTDEKIATCTMFGDSVEITPIAEGKTTLKITSNDNDTAIINVNVLKPTIELKYKENNNRVSLYKNNNYYYLCFDNDTSLEQVVLNAYYTGSEEKVKLNPEISSNWYLGGFNEFADITTLEDPKDLIFKKRNLDVSQISSLESDYDYYHAGYNLGQTSTKLVDPNNNSSVSVMSYLYKFILLDNNENVLDDSYSVTIDQDDTLTFYIKYSSTGNSNGELDSSPTITASNSSIIESVVNEPTGDNNSVGVNVEKTVKVTIKGIKSGNTSITFKGGLCGSKTINLTINGKNKVTFNSNGATSWTSSNGTSSCNGIISCEKQVTNNQKYGTLPTPYKKGYTFLGWYTAISGGTKITEDTIVNLNSDQELYAKWENIEYTLTLKNDSSTFSTIKVKYDTNTLTPSSLTSLPTKTYVVSGFATSDARNSTGATISSSNSLTANLTFNGWFTSSSGGTKILDNKLTPTLTANVDNYVSSSKWIKEDNVTLYSQWGNTSVTLPTIYKEGYTCGFTDDSIGTSVTYASGALYTPTSNKTLYSVCEKNSYTISYNLNGGTAGSSKPTSGYYGQAFKVSNPTKSNYTFVGWTISSGLDVNTAKYGTSSSNVSNAISSSSTSLYYNSDLYFLNLAGLSGSEVTLTAHYIKATCSNQTTSWTNQPNSVLLTGYANDFSKLIYKNYSDSSYQESLTSSYTFTNAYYKVLYNVQDTYGNKLSSDKICYTKYDDLIPYTPVITEFEVTGSTIKETCTSLSTTSTEDISCNIRFKTGGSSQYTWNFSYNDQPSTNDSGNSTWNEVHVIYTLGNGSTCEESSGNCPSLYTNCGNLSSASSVRKYTRYLVDYAGNVSNKLTITYSCY